MPQSEDALQRAALARDYSQAPLEALIGAAGVRRPMEIDESIRSGASRA